MVEVEDGVEVAYGAVVYPFDEVITCMLSVLVLLVVPVLPLS